MFFVGFSVCRLLQSLLAVVAAAVEVVAAGEVAVVVVVGVVAEVSGDGVGAGAGAAGADVAVAAAGAGTDYIFWQCWDDCSSVLVHFFMNGGHGQFGYLKMVASV